MCVSVLSQVLDLWAEVKTAIECCSVFKLRDVSMFSSFFFFAFGSKVTKVNDLENYSREKLLPSIKT